MTAATHAELRQLVLTAKEGAVKIEQAEVALQAFRERHPSFRPQAVAELAAELAKAQARLAIFDTSGRAVSK